MRQIATLSFMLFLGVSSYAADLNGNGIYDTFDAVIDQLPRASMRIAAKQVAFNLQAQIELDVITATKDKLQMMMLNQLISHECFEKARLDSGSSINNNHIFIALAQLGTNEAQRTNLKKTQSQLSMSLFDDNTVEFDKLYERLSPFFGDISGCDHLN